MSMATVEKLVTDHLDLWTAAIKRKSAAGRGSSNKLELYGIPKLRELILKLAVRGLLEPQDPNDEPASELLKKIADREAKLVKEGKTKKKKPLPELDESEMPFTLPRNWTFARWGQIADWAIGSGFPTAAQGQTDQEILFAKVSDMNLSGNEKYIVTTVNSISKKTAEKIKAKAHPPGTVVFPKIGGAIATNKRRILVRDTAIDNNCLGLTPRSCITTDYLYLLLSSVDLSAYQVGTSVPALSQGNLELIVAGLPPIVEQHRIVAKVDELMALCDQLEQQTEASLSAHQTLVDTLLNALTSAVDHVQFVSAWQRISEHFDTLFTTEESIDQLKQTILQLAVMGKLVPQDPNDEPASELLKKIAAEKAKQLKKGKIKKETPLPPVAERDKPFIQPNGWEWVRLENISDINGGFAFKSQQYVDNGIRVIRISDFDENGFKDERIVRYKFSDELNPFRLNPNNILMAMTGGTVGKCLLVEAIPEPMLVNQRVATIKISPQTHPKYVSIMLKTSVVQDVIENTKNSTNDNISMSDIKGFYISLPPLKEQHRIVAKVDELMALCDQLKASLSDAQITQLHLADAIMVNTITQ